MKELRKAILKFRDDRDWKQFHSPENLVKSIVIESAELLECFQWKSDFNREEVKNEIADIFNYLILLEQELGIDLIEVTKEKLEENNRKYPVEKSKGNSKKYTKL